VTELQQNRYDALLRRVGDLKGPGSKVNDVLQELFPTIDVENVPGELLLLMATKIGWAATAKTPAAGKRAGIQLFNPADSGQLITVSRLLLSTDIATTMTFGIVTIALATNTAIPAFRDSRAGTGPGGVSELRTTTDTVALSNGQVRIPSTSAIQISDGNSVCVLSPGTGLSVVGFPDHLMHVTFFYRERVAEPSELSF